MPVTIDFNKIIADLKAAGEEIYNSNDEQVKEVGTEYFKATENRVALLGEKFATKEIDEQFVLDRLEDEKSIFVSQLKSFEVLGLSIAQQAANKTIEILTGAITDIIDQQP